MNDTRRTAGSPRISRLRTLAGSAACIALTTIVSAPAFAAVHPGDELTVTVFNHPEMSLPHAIVSPQGTITVPLAGVVPVAGLEPSAIASRIKSKLTAYLRQPAVAVSENSANNSLFVRGGPGGILKYEVGETLVSAIGDIDKTQTQPVERSRVDLRRVVVIRDEKTLGTFNVAQLQASGGTGPQLYPGDTIVFGNKAIPVRVQGQVKMPGTTFLSSDEPLSDAVAQAYGITPDAVTTRVELTRGGQTTTGPLEGAVFQQPAQPGDVVTIPEAPRISVTGKVTNPGTVTLKSDDTLLSAIYNAGGPTTDGNITSVQVVHSGTEHDYDLTKLQNKDASQNPVLSDGDVVYVPPGKAKSSTSFLQVLTTAAFLGLHF